MKNSTKWISDVVCCTGRLSEMNVSIPSCYNINSWNRCQGKVICQKELKRDWIWLVVIYETPFLNGVHNSFQFSIANTAKLFYYKSF